jgi:hypothetical protein
VIIFIIAVVVIVFVLYSLCVVCPLLCVRSFVCCVLFCVMKGEKYLDILYTKLKNKIFYVVITIVYLIHWILSLRLLIWRPYIGYSFF